MSIQVTTADAAYGDAAQNRQIKQEHGLTVSTPATPKVKVSAQVNPGGVRSFATNIARFLSVIWGPPGRDMNLAVMLPPMNVFGLLVAPKAGEYPLIQVGSARFRISFRKSVGCCRVSIWKDRIILDYAAKRDFVGPIGASIRRLEKNWVGNPVSPSRSW